MLIVIVFNPIAGAGRAATTAGQFQEALRRAGHDVRHVEAQMGPADQWLTPALRGADVVVVIGGDGTVRLVATAAAETGAAVYHVPLGTENLFSREFGMDRDPGRLVEALDSPRIREVDMGEVNGETFLLMVSVGYDAEVIHELTRRRQGAISHLSYAWPIFRQFLRWRPRKLAIEVDGQRIDGERAGFVVIANSRQYAWRLDPAREAIMDDGLLDVVFFPTVTRFELIPWAWRCRRGTQLRHRRIVVRRGRTVRVSCAEPEAYQVDGDMPGSPPTAGEGSPGQGPFTPLEVRIHPGTLRVLLPDRDSTAVDGAV